MIEKEKVERKQNEIEILDRPVISEILHNFLEIYYPSSQPSSRQATKVCKNLCKEINQMDLPQPSDVNDDLYRQMYENYKNMRIANKMPEKSSTKIANVFGVILLKKVFHIARNAVLNSRVYCDFDSEDLFNKLEKELNNSNSDIFKEDLEIEGEEQQDDYSNDAHHVKWNKKGLKIKMNKRKRENESDMSEAEEVEEENNENDIDDSMKSAKKRRIKETNESDIGQDPDDTNDGNMSNKNNNDHYNKSNDNNDDDDNDDEKSNEPDDENNDDDDDDDDDNDNDDDNDVEMEDHISANEVSSKLKDGENMYHDAGSTGGKELIVQTGDKTVATTTTATSKVTTKVTTETSDVLGPDTTYASLSRDEIAKREEDYGSLEFQIVKNDGKMESLEKLLALKSIFGRQLPKMPRDYITRLVFDKNHRSMVGFKNNKVVGGISFRPFHEQGFGEIAFCAITGNEQVKGYGTRLMNHLKSFCQTIQIYRFLTYADNYAIGYFKKQGFTKEITLDEKRYRGYIKDYDGGTLMECVIRTRINYLDVPGMIKKQREAVYEKIKEISNSHIVHNGLKRSKKFSIEDIPGLKEAGYKAQQTEKETKSLQHQLKNVLNEIKNHSDVWPFLDPVSPDDVPDYYDIIKEPIDLSEIDKRLNSGFYRTKDIFISDLRRMFDNCRTYNREDTEYYQCANNLEDFFKMHMRRLNNSIDT